MSQFLFIIFLGPMLIPSLSLSLSLSLLAWFSRRRRHGALNASRGGARRDASVIPRLPSLLRSLQRSILILGWCLASSPTSEPTQFPRSSNQESCGYFETQLLLSPMSEETTERAISNITPEILKPKRSAGKNSVGERESRTSPSFPEEAKPVPNYLRTSSSSCHDFCKYGKKHDIEVKKRRPVHHRLTSSRDATDDEKDQATVATQPEKRKKENVKLATSPDKGHGTKKPAENKQNDLPPEKIIQVSDLPPEKRIQADLPPEKIIQVSDLSPEKIILLAGSPANLAEGSAQAFSDMNFDFSSNVETPASVLGHAPASQADRSSQGSTSIEQTTPETILTVNESDRHISTEPSELLHNPTRIKVDQKATGSNDDFSEFVPRGGLSAEPALVNLMVSSSIQHNYANEKCGSEQCTEEDSTMNRETILPTASGTDSPVHQVDGSANKERKKLIGPIIDAKTKSGMSQLEGEVIGVCERPKVIRKAKGDTSLESNGKQTTTPTARKLVSSTKTETKRRISSSILTPRVKNKASSSGVAQKNHEKTIKISSSLDRGAEKALEQSLKSPSMKSHSTSVPSTRLRLHSKLSPVSQGKIQTRAGKLGLKKGRLDFSELKSEKLNPKISWKQKSPLSGGKNGDSGSKFEADRSTSRKEVIRRISDVVPKSEINRQTRRTASVLSEDKISPAHKLKFSRGKVVNLQPDTNTLKILRFRRAKMENPNVKGDLDKKEYRNRSVKISADSKSPNPKAPTVVLRHQDVQEKKDTQGLLNQVIEETASKLVETRKSKVKALVGAFETVISLQESKLASPPVPGPLPVA